MAMKLVREGKKTEYKQENGQIITVVQPEVYQRIYCKNCGNEVDSEEQATGTCSDCGQPWAVHKATDVLVKVIEMPPCLLYTSPSPRDVEESRMPSSA